MSRAAMRAFAASPTLPGTAKAAVGKAAGAGRAAVVARRSTSGRSLSVHSRSPLALHPRPLIPFLTQSDLRSSQGTPTISSHFSSRSDPLPKLDRFLPNWLRRSARGARGSPGSRERLSSSASGKDLGPAAGAAMAASNGSSNVDGDAAAANHDSALAGMAAAAAYDLLPSRNLRTALYPPVEAFRSGMLKVSDVHSLYWEESGKPDGQPVIFLHGGPGGGTAPNNRRFFDPNFYRIILLDQRGAGKSTPHACLEDNTTWHLVADIETLRQELKIDQWLVFGGSWGSTLSLTYAITHPDRVQGLILRGIFLLRPKEIEWFYQSGADAIFPDAFEPYRSFIPEEERSDLVRAYHKRLMDESNPDVQLAAARRWTGWEMATSYLLPSADSIRRGEEDKFALAFARIENHYFVNRGFFDSDNFVLENVSKIRQIPGVIVQGRYDVVCPMVSAWDLHKAWPEAQFKVIADAGHSANEAGISAQLVAAMEEFKGKLKRR